MALRWKILALLVAARIGLGFQFQTLGSVSDQISAQFHVDYTTIGSLIGIFMVTGLFLALPAGWIGRYVSDRSLAAVGMAFLAAGGFIAAVADTTTQIGFGRVVCGAGFVISTIYVAKMATDWFSGHEIATAMGLLVMTWPLGIAAGQIGHTWIAQVSHWSVPFYVASFYCALAAIALFVAYRQPDKQTNVAETKHPNKQALGKESSNTGLSKTEVLLIVVASASWALFNAGYVVFLSFTPIWLTENSYSTLQAASTTSSASWAMLFSIVAGGLVADRTGKPELVLYACVTVAVISTLALYWTNYALPASILFGLIGAAPAGIIMALASEAIQPQNRALGMGVFFSLYFLLVAPAPVIAGWLVDHSGSAWAAIIFTAILFAATGASYKLFRITRQVIANATS